MEATRELHADVTNDRKVFISVQHEIRTAHHYISHYGATLIPHRAGPVGVK